MRYPFAEEYSDSRYIVLNSNINPFGPSPLALKAILENASRINLYPSRDEHMELKNLLVLKLRDEKVDVRPNDIVLGNGSDEVIDFVFRLAILKFGRPKVIIGEGTFAFYEYCAGAHGLEVIKVRLKDFGYDLDLMLDVIKRNQPCVVAICNPINPTGKIIPFREYEGFLNAIPDDTFVLSDEAYFEFSFYLNNKGWRKDEYRSAVQLSLKDQSKIFVSRTFSKAYGLAGIRLGYLISRYSEEIETSISPPFNVNYLALEAGKQALLDKEFLKRTLENNFEGMKLLESIEETIPSWANFALIRLKKSTTYQDLKRNGILVRDMTAYGFEGFIRVSIGKLEEMERFIEVFRKIEK